MRLSSLWGFGAALACAALLAACGGGGGGSSTPFGGSSGSHPASNQGPGTHVTVVINRGKAGAHLPNFATRRGAKATRNPKYLSRSVQGLQLAVSGSGVTSQTVYADISSFSPLCNTSGPIETCTITVPTLASSEQFTVVEVDSVPSNENGAGYGTAFPSGSNILGAANASESVQLGGSNAIGLQLGLVTAVFYDCTVNITPPPGLPANYSANYGIDTSGVNNAGSGFDAGSRVVVTGGVASTGVVEPYFCDDSSGYTDSDTTPAPIVDVNGSPTPVTITSNSSALTVAPIVNNGTAPPVSAYAQTASVANSSYFWNALLYTTIGVKASASLASPATIVFNNNLTALNPFLTPPNSYALTITYTVVPITVSPMVATVSAAGGTATVTGTDFGAANGMDAGSAYSAFDYNCNDSGGNTLATLAAGSLNTTNWTQPFTITGNNNGTGTCTFYLMDDQASTITQVVTVTVN